MSQFKDHFSRQAAAYARSRPDYPAALFAWLASTAPTRGRAWDAGCGSGQAARGLAAHFAQVVATEASAEQLRAAGAHARIEYRLEPAEHSSLADDSVDLVTVAQALHWFDLVRFYAEVRRVLRPGGMLAVWCYGLLQVDAAVDALIGYLYRDVLGPHWPPERRHIDAGYASLPFPFAERAAPPFAIHLEWTRAELLGYLGTWSAVQRYRTACGRDPLEPFAAQLTSAWPERDAPRAVTWPIHMRVGA